MRLLLAHYDDSGLIGPYGRSQVLPLESDD